MPARLLASPSKPMVDRPIRLMIVDDSIVARTVLSRIIGARPEFSIVALASHAEQALGALEATSVDIIVLDVALPGIDGLTALPELLDRSDGARVLIVSSAAAEGAQATVKALTLGAADTLLKPGAGDFAGRFAEQLVERLLRIGRADAIPRPRVEDCLLPQRSRAPIACLAIGASTGGLHALSSFFEALPDSFMAPILVTQHLPSLFIPYFADQLCEIAGRRARVAGDGAVLTANELLVAPGDGHIRLARHGGRICVQIDRAPAPSGCRPSVDPMIEAVAEIYGGSAAAVVLSGMGRDGLIGAGALAAAGGEVIVQDAASSVVWGMPGAIANTGLATAILPPAGIARRIAERERIAAP